VVNTSPIIGLFYYHPLETGACIPISIAMKAETIAGAPALPVLKEIRRATRAVPSHLAQGDTLLRRCLDLQKRTPGDVGIIWAAARLLTAEAVLGKQLAKALIASKRKPKRKRRQSLKAEIAELNSTSSIFATKDGR